MMKRGPGLRAKAARARRLAAARGVQTRSLRRADHPRPARAVSQGYSHRGSRSLHKGLESHQGVTRVNPLPYPGIEPPEGRQACPREHCGGLLVERYVVTLEGHVKELTCHLCSRTYAATIRAIPFDPLRVGSGLDDEVMGVRERSERRRGPGLQESADNEDSELSPELPASVRRSLQHTDEHRPAWPLDTH